MHSIRTDFGFNLLRTSSKLKTGVIEKKLVGAFDFPYSWIFLPPIFLWVFFLPWIMMRTLSVNHFQSNWFYILYDIRLSSTFLWTFFSIVIFCVCSLLFVLNPMSILHEWLKKIPYQLHWVTSLMIPSYILL